MHRREFIAYGSAATLAATLVKSQAEQVAEAQNPVLRIVLHLEEIYEEMIDGEVLFALTYRDPVTRLIRPPIFLTEGMWVNLRLVNKTRKPRRFAISGWPDDKFPVVAPGAAVRIGFTAPRPGSYIYHETTEGALGRLAGLHGPMVVMPRDGRTPAGAQTPYASPTPAQCALFDALGNSPRFPGEPWRPELPERNLIWMYSEIDPEVNRRLESNVATGWTMLKSWFKPRYFTLNGLSGYDAAHDDTCCPAGYEGEPHLLRTMNAGIATHGPHIHGNHVYCLADVNPTTLALYKCQNVLEVDTWMMKPLSRKDMLLPFIKPDDIPAACWPPKQEPWPLYYPMHCHMEMSQTAGGGSYPQGMVTHWEMLGPRRGA